MIDVIKQNWENVNKGVLNCVPFDLPKFSSVIPGVMKKIQITITAGTGISKTKFTKWLYVYQAIEQAKKHNIPYHVLYFALEESKEEFQIGLIGYLLNKEYGIQLSSLDLKSQGVTPFKKEYLDKIEELRPLLDSYMEHITVVDYITNPTGIFKYVMKYAGEHGTHLYKDKDTGKVLEEDNGNAYYYKYAYNDPKSYVSVICDHVSLLSSERDSNGSPMTQHQTMFKWSSDYCRKMIINKLGYSVINVQQQTAQAEQVNPKWLDGIKPSLANLANNKEIARDSDVVIGLFSPDRFKLTEWEGIDLVPYYKETKNTDCIRSVYILKNRQGRANIHIPFLFNGKVDHFEELNY